MNYDHVDPLTAVAALVDQALHLLEQVIEERGFCPCPEMTPASRYALPSDKADVSPRKARQILRDGSVCGHPLTQAQRGMFGAIAGRSNHARYEEDFSYSPDDEEEVRLTERPTPRMGDWDYRAWYLPQEEWNPRRSSDPDDVELEQEPPPRMGEEGYRAWWL